MASAARDRRLHAADSRERERERDFSDRDCGKNGDTVKHALRHGCKGGTGMQSLQVRRGSVPTRLP